MEFCKLHGAYNAVVRMEGSLVPSQKGVASQLGISVDSLVEKLVLLNQIPPKGYKFFDKKSKIINKLPNAA